MKRYFLIPFVLMILVLAAAAIPASEAVSQDAGQEETLQTGEVRLSPGNYCISCHLAEDPRLALATEWKGGIGREVNSACPAATAIHKELYYTERMLLMIDRAGGAEALTEKMQAQLEAQTQAYSRLLEAPVTSLEAFTSEAQAIRYRLNKVYAAQSRGIEARKRGTVLAIAIGASLIVLGCLIWGWLNTQAFPGGSKNKPGRLIAAAVFLTGVAGFFSLPFFRAPPAMTTVTTPEQQEAQLVLDEADRAASSADRAQARAWMLARLASADPARANPLLKEAWAAVQEARAGENALWGQSLVVQEANIAASIQLEKARLAAMELNAARARQWSLPLIAVEWAKVDAEKAAALLAAEEETSAAGSGPYRDLQLRGAALAWVQIDRERARPSAQRITDPGIRSWTQRELGMLTGDPAFFEEAGESARLVADPIQRARSLRELAIAAGDRKLLHEAVEALSEVTGERRGYALSDLAAAGDASLVEGIPVEFAEARTAALLAVRDEEAAYRASLAITDPIERARAQAAIAANWVSEAKAMQIDLQPYRDLALRDVTIKTGRVSLTHSINSAYYKVEALTALGDSAGALEAAGGLKDPYPLVQLGILLAKADPQEALKLVDEMSREADKAALLKALVAEGIEPGLFEQALGMALAARVRGDALSPAQASLDLARALWTIQPANAQAAWRQALEATRRITIK